MNVTYAPTKIGDSLAWELAEWIGYSADTRSTCAGIVRYANRLHNLAVAECNGHPMRESLHADSPQWQWDIAESYEAGLPAKIDDVTARLHALLFHLPEHDGGRWEYRIEGDPRGPIVGITTPDGREIVAERGRNLA